MNHAPFKRDFTSLFKKESFWEQIIEVYDVPPRNLFKGLLFSFYKPSVIKNQKMYVLKMNNGP